MTMSSKKWETFLQEKIDRMEKQIGKNGNKTKEYSEDDNRFHNFDVAIQLAKLVKERKYNFHSAFDLFLKHFVSIIDILNAPDAATEALVCEKFGDACNYLVLMEGMIIDHIEKHRELPSKQEIETSFEGIGNVLKRYANVIFDANSFSAKAQAVEGVENV